MATEDAFGKGSAAQTVLARLGESKITPAQDLLARIGLAERLGWLVMAIWDQSGVDYKTQEAMLLAIARHFDHPYAWNMHAPRALKAGLSRADVAAIGDGNFDQLPAEVAAACKYAKAILKDMHFPSVWPETPPGKEAPRLSALVGLYPLLFSIHKSVGLKPDEGFYGWHLENLKS